MNITKVISTEFDKLKRRITKVLIFGKNSIRTAYEAAPYGIDSNPIKDMIAIYADGPGMSDSAIVGYVNKSQLAQPGECRTYSTDSKGNLKFYTWLKNNGTFEMGGNIDNAVRYAALNTALQLQVANINIELAKIAAATVAHSTYTVAPITLDISPAKINEIKTL